LLIISGVIGISFYMLMSQSAKFINVDVELNFNGDAAYLNVQAQMDLNNTQFRIPGSQGNLDCRSFFISKFKSIDPLFSYILHNFTIHEVNCTNLIFKLNPHESNILILGAHYDTRARATKDPTISNRNLPVPGANDGASGCGVLLELAKTFYNNRNNLSAQIWFTFFDAEDQGYDYSAGISNWNWCEGSNKMAQDVNELYNSSIEDFDGIILLDMVGGHNLQLINEQYSTSSLLDEIFQVGRSLGYTNTFPLIAISSSVIDDHVAFSQIGIPSADLIPNFWSNPDWPYHHTIQDNLVHVENQSLSIVGKTIEQFIYNNYMDFDDVYHGNYPWSDDLNLPNTDILIMIIVIISFAGIISLLLIIKKVREKKRLS
jgi:glutaminyl-peptide cyclotransferase